MRGFLATLDRELAHLASRQHGVVTRLQLLQLGFSRAAIDRRAKAGSLIKQYRGVYRVGHQAPSTEARYMGAVLRAGDGSVLSGRAAAYMHRLLRGSGPPAPHVTTRRRTQIRGVATRRARLRPIEVTTVRSIPITTVPRTLVDLAGELDVEDLTLVCHEASVRYRTAPAHITAVIELRAKSPPGIANLRRVMIGDVDVVLSKLEGGLLVELRGAKLPLPETNCVAGGRRVDCRWPDHKLTVELLSWRFHNSRHAWEQDHERRREARARGDEFRIYTWEDVFENPEPMLEELRQLLRRAA